MLRSRALALLALVGCAHAATTAASRPALTVVLATAVPRRDAARKAIERALGGSFALTFADPPNAPPEPDRFAGVESDLAAARKAYIAADFGPCLERVGELARVGDLLAQGQRPLGERLLFWRIACRIGAGRAADARRDAATFATYELHVPADVEAAAPEVEGLIADALRAAAAAPRHPLRVTAAAAAAKLPPRASVGIDGRTDQCVTPCTVDVTAGDHAVRVAADGYAPEMRLVRVDESGGAATFTLTPADPALAARQWTARQAGAAPIDGAASVGLLAVALRARDLAVVGVEAAPKGARLTGALALDGAVASRGERAAPSEADAPDAAQALMRDLLLRGRLIEGERPIYKRPWFWVGVGAAAVAAAGITAALLYHPDSQIKVQF
jgi:PEGA domain-containing protein